MKHVYMILAHGKYEQLERLVDRLDQRGGEVFIHVDKKSEDLHARAVSRYSGRTNIHLVRDRVAVNRAGFSVVAAILRLMDLVSATGDDYAYASLMSGQDYPIKSAEYTQEFLERHRGCEFMDWAPIGDNYWRLKCFSFFGEHRHNRKLYIRILDNLLRRPQKLLFLLRRRNFRGMRLYEGSTWFTLSRDCLEYVRAYVNKHPEYVADFKYTYCPDEHFFQMIVLNSPFKNRVVKDDLTYIDWRQHTLGSPKVLTTEDLAILLGSRDLFARKFDLSRDRTVLDRLDAATASEASSGGCERAV